MAHSPHIPCRLEHMPVSFFSIVMGLVGFAIAIQRAEMFLGFPGYASIYVLWLGTIIFVLLAFAYLIKLIRFPKRVKEEFASPVKMVFFPALSVGLLLLSIGFMNVEVSLSQYYWYAGAVMHFLFTLIIVSAWMHHDRFDITHMNPAWFIPAVGNMLVPIAGVIHAPLSVSWFFFSVGFMFWVILLILFFNRIVFHSPIPEKLFPTLFILIAPPAVGMIAHIQLTGVVHQFDIVLYHIALFFGILLFSQIRYFSSLKFFLSWWAYSFPVAALSIASAVLAHKTGVSEYGVIGYVALTIVSLIVAVLLIRTAIAIQKKEICTEEH